MMRLLAPLPNETMGAFAFRVLRYNIISLDMEPGRMYSEKELSSALSLSRTPMREALLQLSRIKIIEIYPNRGTAVSLVDYDLIEEARFLRDAMECAVVQLVCETATAEQLERLRRNVKRQLQLAQGDDYPTLLALDNNFHRQLFTIAKKMQCYEFVFNMTIHFDRVRNMALTAVKEHQFVYDHEAILAAIIHKDSDLAKALMHKHLNRFRVDEAALRKQYPHYFKP